MKWYFNCHKKADEWYYCLNYSIKNRHILKFSKGLSITKENLTDEGIPCVSYGEIHSKFGFDFNSKIDPMKYVSVDYLNTDLNSLLNYGDFIFALSVQDGAHGLVDMKTNEVYTSEKLF